MVVKEQRMMGLFSKTIIFHMVKQMVHFSAWVSMFDSYTTMCFTIEKSRGFRLCGSSLFLSTWLEQRKGSNVKVRVHVQPKHNRKSLNIWLGNTGDIMHAYTCASTIMNLS